MSKVHVVFAGFYVRAVELFDPFVIENSLHRLYCEHFFFDRFKVFRAYYCSVFSRFVHIVCENIPACEFKVVDVCKRNEFLNERRAVFRSFAKSDVSHLGERADRFVESFSDVENTGENRGSDCSHTNEENQHFAVCGLDFSRCHFNSSKKI